jgi:hypothetical protein
MGIKQISVFLENTTGRLCEVTRTLANAGINLRAINIADTAEFGILRLIVDKTDEAANALSAAGFTIKATMVAAVEIEDKPGSLDSLMELIQKSGINIEYLYAFLGSSATGGSAATSGSAATGGSGKAVVVFKMEDHDKGSALLEKSGLVLAERL